MHLISVGDSLVGNRESGPLLRGPNPPFGVGRLCRSQKALRDDLGTVGMLRLTWLYISVWLLLQFLHAFCMQRRKLHAGHMTFW